MSEPARHLRVISDTGEVLDEHPEVQRLEDEIKGLQRALKAEIRRYEDLKRDKEAEAAAHQAWPIGKAIFDAWREATGHKRSGFKADRFFMIEPYLRDKRYGREMCLRAVAGIAFDPFPTRRKNGTVWLHNDWELCFRNTDKLEQYANAAPKDWRDRPEFRAVLEKWS